jgi:hypothetical protein
MHGPLDSSESASGADLGEVALDNHHDRGLDGNATKNFAQQRVSSREIIVGIYCFPMQLLGG